MKPRLPFLYTLISGAIGKRFVIKRCWGKKIMTRYPDMRGIVPSEGQKMRRRLFSKAVKYAQSIYANPVLKEEKRRMLRRPKRLFQALMKEWFSKRSERSYWNQRRLNSWQRQVSMHNNVRQELFLFTEERRLIFPCPSKQLIQLE